jgi:hypothetical protein
MRSVSRWLCGAMVFAFAGILAGMAAPAGAATLIRMGVDDLVASNHAIVVGEVVDINSYWNNDHSLILSDVRLALHDILKGRIAEREITVTVVGGVAGGLTSRIVGGIELLPSHSYLLFLNEEDLPGAQRVLTVRDLSQGVFDIRMGRDGRLRVVSQAARQMLLPDKGGRFEAPGGKEGMPLNAMIRSIRESADRQRFRQEAKLVSPDDPEGGGGGGGTGGGTGGTTTPQYRITYALYRDRIDGSEYEMKAYTQFEKLINGVWTRLDANNVSVLCYVNGRFRDGEGEISASLVHITFDVPYQAGTQIICTHSANDAYYFATSSYTM